MTPDKLSLLVRSRALALVAAGAIALPLAGCGSGGTTTASNSGANLPPVDDTRGGASYGGANYGAAAQPIQQPRTGLSGRQKMVLLVGAAALYYLYRKHQANQANQTTAQNGQPVYYLSKNGRVYYRDATARVHWVTPPPQGVQVPYDEAQQYQGLQGYNGSSTGETDLTRFAPAGGGY